VKEKGVREKRQELAKQTQLLHNAVRQRGAQNKKDECRECSLPLQNPGLCEKFQEFG
jgi:hypothetical protein